MKTKHLSYGAMVLALYGVLLTLDTLSAGAVLATISFIVPIPFVLYSRDYGLKNGLVVTLASFFLGFIIAPYYQAIMGSINVLVGVVYGGLLHQNKNDKQAFITTFIVEIIAYIMSFVILGPIVGYDISTVISEVKTSVEMIAPNANYSESIYVYAAFSTIVMLSFLETYVVSIFSKLLFVRLRKKPINIVRFKDIKYPGYLGVISAVAVLAFIRLSQQIDRSLIDNFIMSLGIVGNFYLAFLGHITIVRHPKFSKYSLYSIIILVFTYGSYFVFHMVIGLFASLRSLMHE